MVLAVPRQQWHAGRNPDDEMPRLLEDDIQTREILGWKGLHLLHFAGSSCSQKTRIFLNLKGLHWVSHSINLATQQNYTPWFLGINPRGLVPVLVHDGQVIIESNDILTYLDQNFPGPRLIPVDQESQTADWLREEDELHFDIRALSMRFIFPPFLVAKKPQSLAIYEKDRGQVAGAPDPRKAVELRFWQELATHGITDAQTIRAATNFRAVFDRIEQRLADRPYLLGDQLQLVDIAWYIYAHRLELSGYPLARLHPRAHRWYQNLHGRNEFHNEVREPGPMRGLRYGLRLWQRLRGTTLSAVAGF